MLFIVKTFFVNFTLRIFSVNETKFPTDLVTFNKQMFNGKLCFLCSESMKYLIIKKHWKYVYYQRLRSLLVYMLKVFHFILATNSHTKKIIFVLIQRRWRSSKLHTNTKNEMSNTTSLTEGSISR